MFETGESLSLNKIKDLFLRKYFNVHNFVIASIVGKGKSIDFYLFIKVGYYP